MDFELEMVEPLRRKLSVDTAPFYLCRTDARPIYRSIFLSWIILQCCVLLIQHFTQAFLIGPGNPRGKRISVDEAEQHIFGLVLMNDWSARDFQKFEMFPLGPFNSKNFVSFSSY